jgi:hypothetical protein
MTREQIVEHAVHRRHDLEEIAVRLTEATEEFRECAQGDIPSWAKLAFSERAQGLEEAANRVALGRNLLDSCIKEL